MNVKPFLRLIRFSNLVIVALTQYLLQYHILIPELRNIHVAPFLPDFPFFLLVLSTVLIAAGGYIVNDIEDVEIDKLNKAEKKQIVGRIYPLSIAWKMYIFSIVVGFIISIYLAFYIDNIIQILIYPAAVGMLYAYSKWWKKQPLIGNLVISFFCAFVAWVVFYAEILNVNSEKLHQSLSTSKAVLTGSGYDFVTLIFSGYAIFAFISTLFREIIKDIEDAEGDKVENCRTLPIVIGIKNSQGVAFLIGLVFLGMVFYYSYILRVGVLQVILLNFAISLPLMYALFLLLKADKKEDFSFLSKFAKFIMLSGVVFILIMKI